MTLTIQSSASPKGESPLRRNLALFASSKMSLFFLGLTLAFVVMAVFAPWIAPHDPNEPDLFRRLMPPAWMLLWSYDFCQAIATERKSLNATHRRAAWV